MYQNIDYVHLTRKDRRQLSRNIKDTLANLKSKKESATFPCIIDLTEDSINIRNIISNNKIIDGKNINDDIQKKYEKYLADKVQK